MNKEQFINAIKKLNIEVTSKMLEQVDIYINYLLQYNAHTNLTAITDLEDIYLKHFYDSLTICNIIDLNQVNTLLDIGSGAGFPGMVLKIFFPNLHIFLVDSNHKKTIFLEELKNKLNVDKLEVINERIEKITPKYLNGFDVVTARAVTNMTVLTELAMPLVKVDGYFVAMKGSNEEEISKADFAITKLNGIIDNTLKLSLPNNGGMRNIIKIKKIKTSKIEELRPYEKIVKKPLQK